MPSTIAVAHYPEGAGHATRMLAIANAFEDAGAEVLMAGGGAGTEFVSLNGYDEFEPTTVDYIDTYQDGSLGRVVTRSVPASARRVREYVDWLHETEPDALVTDDMFAAMAASRTDVPLYVLKHDVPGLYRDRIERAGARFHTAFQSVTAREFFYPAVWPESDLDPDGATRIPPVSLEGKDAEVETDDREIDAADVVLVPSHYSEFDRLADRLERQGYDVLNVGDDDWEPVASLLPYLRGADVVVCSGYSTVMDAAVAGTPCVVRPETDEQAAVAEQLDRSVVTGFAVADDPLDVLDAVASPPDPPEYENGAGLIAETVLDDLRMDESADSVPDLGGVRGSRGRPRPTIDSRSGLSFAVRTLLGLGLSMGRMRSRVIGRAERAATVSVSALLLTGLVAQQVAASGTYLRIEQSLPTYAGGVSGLFLVGGAVLVTLAATSAAFDAGFVPSILVASGPVVGWAVNHWAAAVVPHYQPTFLLEMAVLYGGVFGTIGYLVGIRIRRLPRLRRPSADAN
jgi:UDP-N-acetylglucosamine:LPS N-acetylglucosamine transferase